MWHLNSKLTKCITLLLILTKLSETNAKGLEEIDLTEAMEPIINCAKFIVNNGIDHGEIQIKPFSEIIFPGWHNFSVTNITPLLGQYNFNDVSITGISDFDINSATLLNFQTLVFQFKLHGIVLNTDYDFHARFIDLANIIGTGDIFFKMGLTIDGKINLNLEDFTLNSVEINPDFDTDFQIKGLSVGERMSKIISLQFNDITLGIVNSDDFKKIIDDVCYLIPFIWNANIISIPTELIAAVLDTCGLNDNYNVQKLKTEL